ncbi:MAG: single-stranded DNA-binding protein [Bacteroides sp.]|nr:single-stranded DNA-binding protein [Bacteroidales bacterium]MBD5302541.1 single-stranded DNA-binding protein [Bacteroides sp.]MBD5206132.1 single-stranded DNA-binding protein [Bacteroidales bacterium]MBD5223561.1 single-stranded DNA-binding protein [Bacteroidales bacterium]MBD5305581.1 single-stranded DNA-binding protein [Bacteroides sp.]
MSVNKVILLGFVGSDPEVRYPEKDKAVAFVSLATNDYYSSTGAEITEWHRLVMGGKNAELAEKYIRKGTRLYVEGKIKSREYEDKLKIRRRITEIIVEKVELLGRKQD